MTTVTPTQERQSARARLLAAADELFYAEGVHSVGIDRVIERAGVAKASLYATFGSKDELVRAYLDARLQSRQARINAAIAPLDDARARILAVFDLLEVITHEQGYRGCAFLNASAESKPEESVTGMCAQSRGWTRALFTDLAREAGAADPDVLGAQLQLLYDGVSVAAQLDGDTLAARNARAVAVVLLDTVAG